MLTPSFDVSQDDECVLITLRVPYVKVCSIYDQKTVLVNFTRYIEYRSQKQIFSLKDMNSDFIASHTSSTCTSLGS